MGLYQQLEGLYLRKIMDLNTLSEKLLLPSKKKGINKFYNEIGKRVDEICQINQQTLDSIAAEQLPPHEMVHCLSQVVSTLTKIDETSNALRVELEEKCDDYEDPISPLTYLNTIMQTITTEKENAQRQLQEYTDKNNFSDTNIHTKYIVFLQNVQEIISEYTKDVNTESAPTAIKIAFTEELETFLRDKDAYYETHNNATMAQIYRDAKPGFRPTLVSS
jgi:hypothetical protein